MKSALVLPGGGAKGAFQIGALKTLFNQGVEFDLIIGTSVGAINGLALCYRDIDYAEKVWTGLRGRSDVLRLNWWKLPWATGVYSMKPLKKILLNVVKGQTKGTRCLSCYTDIRTGLVHYADSDQLPAEEFVEYVLASGSIPFFMEPVQDTLHDGGVREIAPVRKAIDEGYKDIWVIATNPISYTFGENWTAEWPKFLSHGVRAIDLLETEVLWNDIVHTQCVDGITIRSISPNVVPMDTLDFDPRKIKSAILMGMEAALDGDFSEH